MKVQIKQSEKSQALGEALSEARPANYPLIWSRVVIEARPYDAFASKDLIANPLAVLGKDWRD